MRPFDPPDTRRYVVILMPTSETCSCTHSANAGPAGASSRGGVGAMRLMPCVLATLAGAVLSACSVTPVEDDAEKQLRRAAVAAGLREISPSQQGGSVTTKRVDSPAMLGIKAEVMPELEKMAGPASWGDEPMPSTAPLGENLLGQPAQTLAISLERAVRTAVENNLAVQFARLSPAIAEAQVVVAESTFDWTLFSNLTYNNTDSPRVATITAVRADVFQSLSNQTGLRRTLIGGGRFTFQIDQSYTDNDTPGLTSNPNPAQQVAVTAQLDQPLLRGFGSEITQAETRTARNAERSSLQTFRRDLARVVTETEKAYWDLVQARADLIILERLLERGVKTQQQLEQRAGIDANQAQIADARARVERRKADVQRAQTQLRLNSDRIKSLMNDPDVPLGSEVILAPADKAIDQPVRFSLADSIRQAVAYRPEVQQAMLAIDDASIRATVARNARLPELTFRLQARFVALDNTPGEAYGRLFSGDFADYLVSLVFETPIGNRRAEADYRRRRLERMQSVIAYRNAIQQTVGEVKSSLSRIQLNYSLISQTKSSRIAASEVLRVLLVEKDVNQGYSVERLDLELNRQESLAAAERSEIEALVEYNKALADLFSSMGTALERNKIEFDAPSVDRTLSDTAAAAELLELPR